MRFTREELDDKVDRFIDHNLGLSLDSDHAYGAQCTEVFRGWVMDVLMLPYFKTGDAWEMPESSAFPWENYFAKMPPSITPRKGDWIIWGKDFSRNGHIALVAKDFPSQHIGPTSVFEQDGSENRYRKITAPDGKVSYDVTKWAKCKLTVRNSRVKGTKCILRPLLAESTPEPVVHSPTVVTPSGDPEQAGLPPRVISKSDLNKEASKSGRKVATLGASYTTVGLALSELHQATAATHGLDKHWFVLAGGLVVVLGIVALIAFKVQKNFKWNSLVKKGVKVWNEYGKEVTPVVKRQLRLWEND